MNRFEVYEASRLLWGIEAQVRQLAEEAAELSVAALHSLRNSKNPDTAIMELVKEVADVQLMIDELLYFLRHREVGDPFNTPFPVAVAQTTKANLEYITELTTRAIQNEVENIVGYTLHDFVTDVKIQLRELGEVEADFLSEAKRRLRCEVITIQPEKATE